MDDLDRVADQWVALADEQRDHGSHLLAGANREPVRMAIGARIVDDELFVAREDGIVGFVMFELESGAFEQDATRGVVRNLYVVPDRRDEGIGSALLDAAEAALVDAGADVLAIEALADNEAARRLYRRHGYRPHRVEFERRPESDTHSRGGR